MQAGDWFSVFASIHSTDWSWALLILLLRLLIVCSPVSDITESFGFLGNSRWAYNLKDVG